ncbi:MULTISPECIES: NAD(P)/FAD-dependent oxidoreductase [Basfia]|uniref:Ndh protein n=2 Tax=Basfia TaxID=697331 RepID=Q65W72_MANSM|nr:MULTISPECIES: NAD(P)/FAD-dependent oxidoreductase [Basfia]AAU36788.1 Ndh protein [[Mannheimia] succiniciproducens MBEL55E]QIM69592.1 NADH dehydrogenase [Basfia succiniciproducens]SCX83970.1 NADH dehydrogenase [Basfia succiniciproducens]SEQ07454.1 NADH dehydrogenase [Basfia succiniciproducens]
MKNIVIVGGGAGGLELATYLGNNLGKKQRANVVLVDRNQTHLWKPLLHEVATGVLDSETDAVSYRAHAHNHYFNFEQGSITRIDRTNKYVELAPVTGQEGDVLVVARRIPYDYLVIAIGSKSNDFNTKGVAENCIFLDSPNQALRFQHKMLELFLKFSENNALEEIGEDDSKQRLVQDGKVNIAIVGGGATGVELSAELFNAAQHLSSYGYGKIQSGHLQVTLIEAGDRILPALPERISSSVQQELENLGVTVKTGTMITEATEKCLITKEGEEINADLMVWAAGIRVSAITQQFDGLEVNRINQLNVKNTLQTTVDDSIFAIGDCAFLLQKDGKPVPPRGQAANQMATICGQNIVALFNNKPLKDFHYFDKGSLVSLSKFTALGNITTGKRSSLTIEGRLARLAYISLYRLHQQKLHGCFKTGLIILIGRLNRFIRPSLKLH